MWTITDYSQRSGQRYQEWGRDSKAVAMNNFGLEYAAQGRPLDALQSYNQALRFHRQIGEQPGVSVTLDGIGTMHLAPDKRSQALADFMGDGEKLIEVGDMTGEMAMRAHIAQVYEKAGELSSSLDHKRTIGFHDAEKEAQKLETMIQKANEGTEG